MDVEYTLPVSLLFRQTVISAWQYQFGFLKKGLNIFMILYMFYVKKNHSVNTKVMDSTGIYMMELLTDMCTI
jgi:hypothetical protein